MSVTIPFPPEIEAKLREHVAASGTDVDSFVRQAIEEKLGMNLVQEKSLEQWHANFDAWMHEVEARTPNYPAGFVVDDSRESIYEGRGQ